MQCSGLGDPPMEAGSPQYQSTTTLGAILGPGYLPVELAQTPEVVAEDIRVGNMPLVVGQARDRLRQRGEMTDADVYPDQSSESADGTRHWRLAVSDLEGGPPTPAPVGERQLLDRYFARLDQPVKLRGRLHCVQPADIASSASEVRIGGRPRQHQPDVVAVGM